MAEVRFKVLDQYIDHEHTAHMDSFMLGVASNAISLAHGESGLKDPSDIEVSLAFPARNGFALRSWHETGSAEAPGRFRVIQSELQLTSSGLAVGVEDKVTFALNERQLSCFAALVGTFLLSDPMREMRPPPDWLN